MSSFRICALLTQVCSLCHNFGGFTLLICALLRMGAIFQWKAPKTFPEGQRTRVHMLVLPFTPLIVWSQETYLTSPASGSSSIKWDNNMLIRVFWGLNYIWEKNDFTFQNVYSDGSVGPDGFQWEETGFHISLCRAWVSGQKQQPENGMTSGSSFEGMWLIKIVQIKCK